MPTLEHCRSMLEAASPAVLTTYRRDGSALTSPVWYRRTGAQFEVVVPSDDVKVEHLTRDPRCVLVVFEVSRPFRGVEVRGEAELHRGDVTEPRTAIASRYLGAGAGARFAAGRARRCSYGSARKAPASGTSPGSFPTETRCVS